MIFKCLMSELRPTALRQASFAQGFLAYNCHSHLHRFIDLAARKTNMLPMVLNTQTTAQNAPSYMSSDMVAQPVASIHGTGSCSDSGSRTPPKPGELRMTRSHGAQPRTAAGRRPAAVKKRASSRAVSAGPRFIEMSPGTPTIA